MKSTILMGCMLFCGWTAMHAATVKVEKFRYAGPYTVPAPLKTDSTDVNGKAFGTAVLLNSHLPIANTQLSPWSSLQPTAVSDQYTLHLASFFIENQRYAKASLNVSGIDQYRIFVDGAETKDKELTLTPATHEVTIQYLIAPGQTGQPSVSIETEHEADLSLSQAEGRMYTLQDVLYGERVAGVSVSADGRYLITSYVMNLKDGSKERSAVLTELASGKTTRLNTADVQWMPVSNRYYYTRTTTHGRDIVTVDPQSGHEQILATAIPEGSFRFSPTEDYLLYTLQQKGPSEDKDIYETIVPDDRQPGWRNRSYLARYDLKSGLMQQLTFGHRSVYASSISSDGKEVILMTSRQRLTQRPFDLMSVYKLNLETMQTDTLITDDGFISNCQFSPDNRQLLVTGSGEAFGGIGLNIKEGQRSSMVDNQLFLFDIASRKATPLTKDFNPSIISSVWSTADKQVYFTANNKDCISFYRMNPSDGNIHRMEMQEELVSGFSMARTAPVMAYFGQSASNGHRVYTLNLKNRKSNLTDDLNEEILKGVTLGRCEAWDYVNSRGDTICGRFYLPPHFDPSKKYPLIVNYYGGCSPVERTFESRYPHHAYAALGYVVYVLQPSGAVGFGQEFSARHVNTWGEYVADDIIEGTRQFCKEHAFVNEKKIGCIGASYGGFMTQYLQTRTDIFAAAISHAGISDITSYWGEGYWGYSYSQIASADSYPWSHPEMYTRQSPLFNADKIHTPLLFLHGDADTNVPVGESIQMFTALKLLGRETAFVSVSGQDHHIIDYGKRIKWQNTIFAWFAKWLQDSPLWWETLYPEKSL